MQDSQIKTRFIANDPAPPGPQLSVNPRTSSVSKRRYVAFVSTLLLLASSAIFVLLTPWRSWVGLSDRTLSQSWDDAQRALETHEYETARNLLADCLDASPYHAEAHFLMARAYRLTGDPDAWLFHL